MADTTLNGSTIGQIDSVDVLKNMNVEEAPYPRKDSKLTKLFDFLGATKGLVVSGVYNGTTISSIKTNFIDVIEAIADGFQDNTIEFYDDMTGTLNVMIQSFSYGRMTSKASLSLVSYSITLVEGVKGGQA